MRPRASRPDALQSVTVLEVLEGLAAQHGQAGVPFKDLETATRSRLNYRALTDALNALVNEGAVRRVSDKPARLEITDVGRTHERRISRDLHRLLKRGSPRMA